MRGDDQQQSGIFSYISAEQRVPAESSAETNTEDGGRGVGGSCRRASARLYAKRGRPSIAPEKLLRALLLQVLYTIRSERQLMEQLDYNLLYRWFVGLNMDDAMWDVTVFTKNRERLAERRHRAGVLRAGAGTGAGATESAVGRALHGGRDADRSVGGTEEFSAQGMPQRSHPEDGGSNPTVNFHGEKRQQSTRTGPRPIRKRCCIESRGAANPS